MGSIVEMKMKRVLLEWAENLIDECQDSALNGWTMSDMENGAEGISEYVQEVKQRL